MFLIFEKIIKNTRGMTLIEIMLAVLIIGLVVIPLVQALYKGIEGSVRFGDANKAIQFSQELMEEIKQKKWDANEPVDGGVTPGASRSNIGRDAARNEIDPDTDGSNGAKVGGLPADPNKAWDDIDDYDGLVEQPPRSITNDIILNAKKFTRSVQVQYVTIGSAAPTAINTVTLAAVGVKTDYKQITVTVNWEGNHGKAMILQTVIANVKKY